MQVVLSLAPGGTERLVIEIDDDRIVIDVDGRQFFKPDGKVDVGVRVVGVPRAAAPPSAHRIARKPDPAERERIARKQIALRRREIHSLVPAGLLKFQTVLRSRFRRHG